MGYLIWFSNLNEKDVNTVIGKVNNEFWRDVLKSWCWLNYCETLTMDQPVWWNSLVRVGNKPIFWKKVMQNGLEYVHQLFQDQSFIPIDVAQRNFGLSVMQYNALRSAINAVKSGELCTKEPLVSSLVYCDNITRRVYSRLLEKEVVFDNVGERWVKDLGEEISEEDLSYVFIHTRKLTTIGKFRSFQYRLIRRAIVLNSHLKRWNRRENDLCSRCATTKETISHLFYECDGVCAFWRNVFPFIQQFNRNVKIDMCKFNFLFNQIAGRSVNITNFLCLVFKQFVYRQRCLQKDLSMFGFKNYVYEIQNSEKYYAIKNNKLYAHYKKWEPERAVRTCEMQTDTDEFLQEYIDNL